MPSSSHYRLSVLRVELDCPACPPSHVSPPSTSTRGPQKTAFPPLYLVLKVNNVFAETTKATAAATSSQSRSTNSGNLCTTSWLWDDSTSLDGDGSVVASFDGLDGLSGLSVYFFEQANALRDGSKQESGPPKSGESEECSARGTGDGRQTVDAGHARRTSELGTCQTVDAVHARHEELATFLAEAPGPSAAEAASAAPSAAEAAQPRHFESADEDVAGGVLSEREPDHGLVLNEAGPRTRSGLGQSWGDLSDEGEDGEDGGRAIVDALLAQSTDEEEEEDFALLSDEEAEDEEAEDFALREWGGIGSGNDVYDVRKSQEVTSARDLTSPVAAVGVSPVAPTAATGDVKSSVAAEAEDASKKCQEGVAGAAASQDLSQSQDISKGKNIVPEAEVLGAGTIQEDLVDDVESPVHAVSSDASGESPVASIRGNLDGEVLDGESPAVGFLVMADRPPADHEPFAIGDGEDETADPFVVPKPASAAPFSPADPPGGCTDDFFGSGAPASQPEPPDTLLDMFLSDNRLSSGPASPDRSPNNSPDTSPDPFFRANDSLLSDGEHTQARSSCAEPGGPFDGSNALFFEGGHRTSPPDSARSVGGSPNTPKLPQLGSPVLLSAAGQTGFEDVLLFPLQDLDRSLPELVLAADGDDGSRSGAVAGAPSSGYNRRVADGDYTQKTAHYLPLAPRPPAVGGNKKDQNKPLGVHRFSLATDRLVLGFDTLLAPGRWEVFDVGGAGDDGDPDGEDAHTPPAFEQYSFHLIHSSKIYL